MSWAKDNVPMWVGIKLFFKMCGGKNFKNIGTAWGSAFLSDFSMIKNVSSQSACFQVAIFSISEVSVRVALSFLRF